MLAMIKALVFLIIGIGVGLFTIVSATVIAAALGGIFIGWLATLPLRRYYHQRYNDRRSKVR